MSPALQQIVQSPQGVILILCSVVLGLCLGIIMMAGIEWLEARDHARRQREAAMKPRVRSEIIAPETPLQRLVREAEQHERKSA